MQFSVFILAAVCKLSALAAARGLVQNHPAESGTEARSVLDTTGVVAWIGEVHPGQGNITLTGTDAFDIIDQIKAMNPDHITLENQSIRDTNKNPVWDNFQALYCGNMGMADIKDAEKITFILVVSNIKGEFIVPAHKCTRVGCINTSGIYVCNDDVMEQRMSVDLLMKAANGILHDCCLPVQKAWHGSDFGSGQAFHKTQQMSVAVAYANCKHAADADRPTDFPYPAANGECCQICQWDSKHKHRYGGGFGHDGL